MEKLIEAINEVSESICNYADRIKMFVYAVATWYLATFSEVIPTFKIITAVFIAQILAGTFVGVNIKHEDFSKTKFFKAILEAVFYLMTVKFISEIGKVYNDVNLAKQVIKYITYLVTWAYGCSLFKNLKLLFPESKPISIIYELLSTEIYKKIKNKYKTNKDETGTTE